MDKVFVGHYKRSHSVVPFVEQLQSYFINHHNGLFRFRRLLSQFVAFIHSPHNDHPLVLLTLMPQRDFRRSSALFFGNQVLGFIFQRVAFAIHLKLRSVIIYVHVAVTPKPLRSKAVLNKHLTPSLHWFAVHFISQFGIDMLQHPDDVEALFVGDPYLLLSRYFRTSVRWNWKGMQKQLINKLILS